MHIKLMHRLTSNSLIEMITSYLFTYPSHSLTGHGYSKSWSWDGSKTLENHRKHLRERAYQHSLTTLYPKPSKDIMFDEWAADHCRLPHSDPHCSFTPFYNRPSCNPHPWTEGVLSALSRHIQSTSFQIITKHAFEADYSDHFRPTASDRTDCPYCSDRYTIHHILIDCNHFIKEQTTCYDFVSSTHEWFRN
jgi:hypothetical protein